jgi:hypothetical protein
MNDALCKDFTEEEIGNALFQIGHLKTAGPDGFPSRFFQRNWETMKVHMIRGVKNVFSPGVMLAKVNETTIVLTQRRMYLSY